MKKWADGNPFDQCLRQFGLASDRGEFGYCAATEWRDLSCSRRSCCPAVYLARGLLPSRLENGFAVWRGSRYNRVMSNPVSRPWPPPPDLSSIQELVRTSDPQGLISEGAHADEYEPEELSLLNALSGLPTAEILVTNILPPLEVIWQKSFSLSEEELAVRRPKLLSLAKEIERFFGPESQPRTRGEILGDNASDTPAG